VIAITRPRGKPFMAAAWETGAATISERELGWSPQTDSNQRPADYKSDGAYITINRLPYLRT